MRKEYQQIMVTSLHTLCQKAHFMFIRSILISNLEFCFSSIIDMKNILISRYHKSIDNYSKLLIKIDVNVKYF